MSRPIHQWAKCQRCLTPLEFYVQPDGNGVAAPYGGSETGWWLCPRESECKNEPSKRAQKERKKKVSTPKERAAKSGYMEATCNFQCGNCVFLANRVGADNHRTGGPLGYCEHPKVRQPVDVIYGCCNRFIPRDPDDLIFSAAKLKE